MNQDINNFNQQNNEILNNQTQQNNQNINNGYRQNQNIVQSSSFNQQSIFGNTVENNNPYQQSAAQSNVPYTNINNKPKQNKMKFIGIIAIVIVVLLAVIILFGGSTPSNSNGYTVDYGETLKVNELEGFYDFEMEVLSVEKDYLIDEVFHSGECLALKVKIKNNSSEDLSISPMMMSFNLLDSSNNEISSLNISMSSTMTDALEEIPSGQEGIGYFYFFDVNEDGKTSNIKNNNIAKLEVEVMKHIENKDGIVSGDYEQYYIKLE